MRDMTRRLSLALLAASLTLAQASSDKGGPAETKEVAEGRAAMLEFVLEAERLEAKGERLRIPGLSVMAGAMFQAVHLRRGKFGVIEGGPAEARADEKPDEEIPLEVRAAFAFNRAMKRAEDSDVIRSLVNRAKEGKLAAIGTRCFSMPLRQARTLLARGKHTFDFVPGQVAAVGFAANGAPLKFHVRHPRLGTVGGVDDLTGTWQEMVKGAAKVTIQVTIENPHGRPVSYAIYRN